MQKIGKRHAALSLRARLCRMGQPAPLTRVAYCATDPFSMQFRPLFPCHGPRRGRLAGPPALLAAALMAMTAILAPPALAKGTDIPTPTRAERAAAGAAAGALAASPASAANGIRDYAYTPLAVNEGAPADIWTLDQDRSGLLWLGTGMGLFRFDGLRFERYPLREGERLPSTNINALMVMPDGDIWLGFYGGGAARLRDGRVQAFSTADGLPSGRILHFAKTGDGALWAAAGTGLARFAEGRWQVIGRDWGFTDGAVDYVHVDRRGVLWVCSSRRLLFLLPGERRLRDTGLAVARSAVVAEDLQGRLWLSEGLQGTRPLPTLTASNSPVVQDRPEAAASPSPSQGRPAPRLAPAYAAAKQMLFARDGSVWLTVAGSGVWRLPAAADIPTGHVLGPQDGLERFEREQGLTSPVVVPLVEDREGTVWVGSNNGLGSFQRTRLHELAGLGDAALGGFAVVPWRDGVLAANLRTAVEADPPAPAREQGGPVPARDAIRTADGAVWWLADGRLYRRDEFQTRALPLPAAFGEAPALALLPEGDQGLWISLEDHGLYLATPQGVQRDARLRELRAPQTMARGPDGALWMANENEVLRWADDHLTRWSREDGLAIGRATALSVTERRVVAAGENGVAFFDGRRFVTITQSSDAVFGHVTGIVESRAGDLWLNGGRGVVQVLAQELEPLFDHPEAPLNYRLFDRRDGLPGIALQAGMVPTALRDRRGRLWFVTNRGVAWLDPATVPRNNQPPLTEIHGVRSGEQHFRADEGLTLPAGTTHLTLSYTAITLAAADRARFRYQLEGVDRGWHEAGGVREATYANLAPGRYRFRVVAANGDGVWDTRGAQLDFRIAPTWAQTRSFALGAVTLVALLAWAAYRMRTRSIARQVQWRMEERHRERERIARELHDTLLQGVQGLVLQFNSVARRVEQPEVHGKLERALENAERLILAARDRVSDLRTHSGPLSEDLATAAAAHGDPRVHLQFQVEGAEPALRPTVRDELLMIGREALSNALRHANASHLAIWLTYDKRRMTLRIVDDGLGIPPEFASPDGRPGHHGIKGMFERARRLHGSLRMRHRAEGGTEVEVRVLASHAYAPAAGEPTRRLLRALRYWLVRPLRRLVRRRRALRR